MAMQGLSDSTANMQNDSPANIALGQAQTETGQKTFTQPVIITAASNQLVLASGSSAVTINSGTQTNATTLKPPNMGGVNGTFDIVELSQTLTGTKTFSARTLDLNSTSAGATVTFTVTNNGNTASSNSLIDCEVQNGSSLIPYYIAGNGGGAGAWWGMDPADSNAFKIGQGKTFATNTNMRIDASTGVTTLANGMQFGNASPVTLNFYTSTTTTIGWTGPFTGTQTVAVNFTRIGNNVTMTMAGFSVAGAGSSGPITAAVGTIPSAYRAAVNAVAVGLIMTAGRAQSNTAEGISIFQLGTSGGITIYFNLFNTNFVNTGTCLVNAMALSWSIS